jgi:hypothetical protein
VVLSTRPDLAAPLSDNSIAPFSNDPRNTAENSIWGEERIANELKLKLEIRVSRTKCPPREVRDHMRSADHVGSLCRSTAIANDLIENTGSKPPRSVLIERDSGLNLPDNQADLRP